MERLQQGGLEQRCLQLAAREASEAELGLVHRSDPPHRPRGATHHRGHRLGRANAQPARVLKTELPSLPQFHYWVDGGGNSEVGGPTGVQLLPLLPSLLGWG